MSDMVCLQENVQDMVWGERPSDCQYVSGELSRSYDGERSDAME